MIKPLCGMLVTPKLKNRSIDSKQPIIWKDFHQKVLDEVINYFKFPDIISNSFFTRPLIIHYDASQNENENY